MDFSTTGKLPWQSRAFVGAFVGLLAFVLQFFGFHVDKIALTNDTLQAIGIIGLAWSLWGTIKRTQPIVWTRGTVPGGAFNPQAEVRKAEPVPPGPLPSSIDARRSSGGYAYPGALGMLGLCFISAGILIACHPQTPEVGSQKSVVRPERNPDVPRVLHPDFSTQLSTFKSQLSPLFSSLQVSPGIDIGTNSHGQTIYGPSLTLRGGIEF
jgi:hypothetical protein